MGFMRFFAFRVGVLCVCRVCEGVALIPIVTSRTTSPTSSIAFVSFGDWGMPEGAAVLTRTRERIRSLPQVDFISLLGDNYYGSNSSDMLQLFDVCRVSQNLVHYAVLGNHDYRGHHLFQLGLSKTDPSWHLPSPYYAKLFRSGNVAICAIFIDTELIHTKSGLNDQISWMKQVLMSESCQAANWRIVSGHRNVFTGGIYSKEVRVKEAIHWVLTEGRVHVYYSGHEHNMQLLHDGKILYGISGKINQGMKPIEYYHEFLKWHAHEVPGFIYTVATPSELRLVMYGTDVGPIKSIRLTHV